MKEPRGGWVTLDWLEPAEEFLKGNYWARGLLGTDGHLVTADKLADFLGTETEFRALLDAMAHMTNAGEITKEPMAMATMHVVLERVDATEARNKGNRENASRPRFGQRHPLRDQCEAWIEQVCVRNPTLSANAVAERVLGKIPVEEKHPPSRKAVAGWAREMYPDRF